MSRAHICHLGSAERGNVTMYSSYVYANVVSGQQNDLFLLMCDVFFFSLTALTFSWIFNEYPSFVKQDSRRFVSQETGNLYIAKVEPSDVGNYTCVVTNTVTKTRVQGPPTPLILRTDGEDACRCLDIHNRSYMRHSVVQLQEIKRVEYKLYTKVNKLFLCKL